MCACVWNAVFVPDSSFGSWLSLTLGLNSCCWMQLEKPRDEWSLCKANESKSKIDAWQRVNKQTPDTSRSSLEMNAAAKTNTTQLKSNYYTSNLKWPSNDILHKSNRVTEMFHSQMRKEKNGGTCVLHRKKWQLWVLMKDLMKSQSS